MPRKPATKPKHFFQIKFTAKATPTIVKRRLLRTEFSPTGTRMYVYGSSASARVQAGAAAFTFQKAKEKVAIILNEKSARLAKQVAAMQLEMVKVAEQKRMVVALKEPE